MGLKTGCLQARDLMFTEKKIVFEDPAASQQQGHMLTYVTSISQSQVQVEVELRI